MFTYLERLTARLTFAISRLPGLVQERHTQYLLDAQCEDGGFAGRQGASDLYYTGFALRGLAILGKLQGQQAKMSASFLREKVIRARVHCGFPFADLWCDVASIVGPNRRILICSPELERVGGAFIESTSTGRWWIRKRPRRACEQYVPHVSRATLFGAS